VSQEHEGLLRLHLPALESAEIESHTMDRDWGPLQVDKDSLRACPELTSLSFSSIKPVTFQPDCFSGGMALAKLTCFDCDLVSIPSALKALEGSLSQLALPKNIDLQLARKDVKILLALPKLEILDMMKPDLDFPDGQTQAAIAATQALLPELNFVPTVWSSLSMQNLTWLAGRFAKKHGHPLDI